MPLVTDSISSLVSHPTDAVTWVTVICTCFNHEAYVEKALQSVVDQTYPYVELIIIDNDSSDHSVDQIINFITRHPTARFIQNPQNLGLNRAFNLGLSLAKGRYVVDLSADDVLLPTRLEKQVAQFEMLSDTYAVVFSNATYIDSLGSAIGLHYPINAHGQARARIPSGNVFKNILETYFICTPTMLMRRDVLNQLGGYDESLAYEDFDFWVRSARTYQYAYLDEVLTLKRRLPTSLSAQVSYTDNKLLESTLVVCQKAYGLCQTPDEFAALTSRLSQFIRKAFYTEQFELVERFGELLQRIERPDLLTYLVLLLGQLRVPVNSLYRFFLRQRRSPASTF
ncbi:glycosyltransferase [Spirosoma sp. BT702]|uniref:Glycosyltransferase n=1 Tax=Spirosoma profusum TaxID=2771354 RepID=A0A927AUQ2_9BACT|nr:glycosyltransferase [Spirosoma profusum]MBD2704764.1 glycosyltransferase [Spirosoma profusum]